MAGNGSISGLYFPVYRRLVYRQTGEDHPGNATGNMVKTSRTQYFRKQELLFMELIDKPQVIRRTNIN